MKTNKNLLKIIASLPPEKLALLKAPIPIDALTMDEMKALIEKSIGAQNVGVLVHERGTATMRTGFRFKAALESLANLMHEQCATKPATNAANAEILDSHA